MRAYVKKRDYFGPDRRHHHVPVEVDLRGGDGVDTGTPVMVRAHLDALQAVLSAGLCSDGGKVGRKLVHELHRANRKVVRRAPDRQLPGSG